MILTTEIKKSLLKEIEQDDEFCDQLVDLLIYKIVQKIKVNSTKGYNENFADIELYVKK